MEKYNKINILHYLVLLLVLVAGLSLLLMYNNHPELQFFVGVGIAISYFSWGITHHYLIGDLHRKHVVEYGILAILGIILLKVALL